MAALVSSGLLAGCSLVASPTPAPVHGGSLAPSGPVGYVVCPGAVTPIELTTATAEATIQLPLSGTPALGDFAIASSPDGHWAYVVTGDGGAETSSTATSTPTSTPASSSDPASAPTSPTTSAPPIPSTGAGAGNVIVPIDLVTQQAERPIVLPTDGPTHAIVVLAGGRTILAASGSTIVPVDVATRRVGTPLDLGAGHTVFGLAVDPTDSTVYALVPGGVIPVDTATGQAGAEIATGLTVSSVNSPHGIVVTADGSRVYVVGQSGADFGGRVLPIDTATATTLPEASFDRFGIADPAAVAVTADGSTVLVADAANNWVNLVQTSAFDAPLLPAKLPEQSGDSATGGTQHPTDIVIGPGDTGGFVVDGFNSVIPFAPSSQEFGPPIRVCSGASSMTVAPTP